MSLIFLDFQGPGSVAGGMETQAQQRFLKPTSTQTGQIAEASVASAGFGNSRTRVSVNPGQ